MSRDALVNSRHTPVSPRNLKRRRMSAAAGQSAEQTVGAILSDLDASRVRLPQPR